ncbi:TonB-dependent siderophore receptor [Novosphingobium sp. P6W]|uniref:TonB-dependent receptor plug domain-containing protein n=1 Tax=Novosphingobium sp. P6W TaxID=1609758 RepID=UPI0005C2DF66|nr:TonB-dependent receptor [Novosphingobium sp. P6W]AXB80208.1 TonB-dependent receptor [Novosphingobium sp. P6W]KIS31560.1 TonB-dependent receptor [Novosphingobium sp. P6W]
MRNRFNPGALCVSLAALCAATPALAQSNPSVASENAQGEQIVVTGTRSGEGVAVRDLPASITVISDADLQERQTRIVSDVLRDVPGVAVSRTGAIGGLTQIRIRGTEGNHVLVLIDGIEAADPYNGEYDFGTLIADPAARIEVLRGQQSSLYGSDAIGGVIQYITLTGREAPGVSVRAEGGSFGTYTGSARIAGYSDTFDYAVSGSLYQTDGTRTARYGTRDVGSTNAGASAKLNWAPSEAFKLTGVARYSYTDADTNDSEDDPTSPLFGYTVDSPGVHYRNEAIYALVRGELSLADGRWITAMTGQIADTERKGYNEDGFDYGDKGTRYKGSLESSYRFGSDHIVHRLTGAVDFEREEFRNTTPSAFVFQGKRSTENLGLVGQYELTVDDALQLGASVRYDDNNRFDDVTTWRAQAGYRLPFGLRLRGAFGTGVKNPGYYELYGYSDGEYIGNPNLKPEKSEGWEAGVDQIIAGGLATIGATYFDSRLKDEIYTTYPAPDFIATPSNRATKSRQKGVEVFLSAQPIEQIKFDLAYTYLNSKENDVTEVRRPRHVGSVNATVFSNDKRFAGTLTMRYNGRQTDVAYTDPSYVPVRVSLKEYVLVNFNADYKVTESISVFGRVENLTNEDYEEVFSFATPGRAVYGGLKAKF